MSVVVMMVGLFRRNRVHELTLQVKLQRKQIKPIHGQWDMGSYHRRQLGNVGSRLVNNIVDIAPSDESTWPVVK